MGTKTSKNHAKFNATSKTAIDGELNQTQPSTGHGNFNRLAPAPFSNWPLMQQA